ncbi:MAG: Holliday junction resolvase RuvX [Thermodesulfobacteriota bacterium]
MRILGLDVGSKRIGVAMSDPLGIIAQGLTTLQCKNQDSDRETIVGLIRQYEVQEIVVGIPYHMNGSEGPEVKKIREFVSVIREAVSLPIHEWDERLSTVAAERLLIEADMSRKKRRKVVDKVAAVIILQGFLDKRRHEVASQS